MSSRFQLDSVHTHVELLGNLVQVDDLVGVTYWMRAFILICSSLHPDGGEEQVQTSVGSGFRRETSGTHVLAVQEILDDVGGLRGNFH